MLIDEERAYRFLLASVNDDDDGRNLVTDEIDTRCPSCLRGVVHVLVGTLAATLRGEYEDRGEPDGASGYVERILTRVLDDKALHFENGHER
ncbi:hypothetical protein [Mycolicibacterium fortuitum]|uniref:hypothetical protein n=1 Tax=Mycolicibacterium fortuitum TaxID=1766 RepID=UPI00149034D4|nr:hypothetical protein [Mycolicibacterium fortuitum]